MIATIRSEWLKLRTVRLNLWLPGLSVALLLLVTVLVAVLSEQPGSLGAYDLVIAIGGFSILVSMGIGVTTSLGITSEFNHDTIRPTLAATPARSQVFAAKAIVSAAFGALVALIGLVVSYPVGAVILSSRGAQSMTPSGDDGTLATLVGIVVLAVLLALFGFGLGLLVRNGPAAASIVVLWPLLIENIVAVVLTLSGVEEPVRFLPYSSAFSLVTPDDSDPGRVAGGVFFGLVAIALVVAGSLVNQRRDV